MAYLWRIFFVKNWKRNAGHAVSRATIIEQVWRLNVDTMTNVVDVCVNYLRRKIDSGYDRPLIRTIRGTGYQPWNQRSGGLAPNRCGEFPPASVLSIRRNEKAPQEFWGA
jgi:hypothetical protein